VMYHQDNPAFGEIKNSKHDFSAFGTGGIWGSADVDETCVFCHTPHNSTSDNEAPLWNREPLTKSFSLYASSTMDANVAMPTGPSLACLSCHDGTIAVDAFINGQPGAPKMMAIGDVYYPGSPYGEMGPNIGEGYAGSAGPPNISNDHPVSFVYDALLAVKDGELADPLTLPPQLPLFSGRMECATCHDVHATTPGIPKLLRMDNSGSALCMSCHVK